MKLLVSFLTVISTVHASDVKFPVLKPGRCRDVPFQPDFTLKEYLGKWYEIERFPSPFEQGRCIQAQYSLQDNGKVNVLNRYVDDDGIVHTATGEASIPDAKKPAVLSVKFKSSPFPDEYRVVTTDYTEYSLVTSCTSFGFFHIEFAWILSRDLTLSRSTVSKLRSYLGDIGFPVSKFQLTTQTGCSL